MDVVVGLDKSLVKQFGNLVRGQTVRGIKSVANPCRSEAGWSEGEARSRAALRRDQLLSHASALFGHKGFEATSMRDIASAAGIRPGSLYYHFASKEEIFVAVLDESIGKISRAVDAALARPGTPWERFEAAAIAHCEAMLHPIGFHVLATPLFPPNLAPEIRAALVAQRDQFEQKMSGVIAGLPMAPDFDCSVFRRQYLGAINWISVWYRPGGRLTPAAIARQFVQTMRGALDVAALLSAGESDFNNAVLRGKSHESIRISSEIC